jgi:hypothetical protein
MPHNGRALHTDGKKSSQMYDVVARTAHHFKTHSRPSSDVKRRPHSTRALTRRPCPNDPRVDGPLGNNISSRRRGACSTTFVSANEVKQRSSRLVLGWVTVLGIPQPPSPWNGCRQAPHTGRPLTFAEGKDPLISPHAQHFHNAFTSQVRR